MNFNSGKLVNYALTQEVAINIQTRINDHNKYVQSFSTRLFEWSNFARNIVLRAKFGGIQPYRAHGIVDLSECVPSFAGCLIHDDANDYSAFFRKGREVHELKKIANSCDLHSFRGLAMLYNLQSYTNRCHHTNWHTKLVYGISAHWKLIFGTLPNSCASSKTKTVCYLRYKLFNMDPVHYTFSTMFFQKFPNNKKCNNKGQRLSKTLLNMSSPDSPITIQNEIMFKEQHLKKVNFLNKMLAKKVIALSFEKGRLPWEKGTRRYTFVNVNDAIITKCQKLF